ncbi:MAG: tetratricopeptide repeat protein [Nitrospirota bacterium]
MHGNTPVIKRYGWSSILPQLIVFLMIMIVIRKLSGGYSVSEAMLPSVLIYIALSIGLRHGLIHSHRRGVKLIRRGMFRDAIPFFEKSYSFFSKHPQLDKWRYVALMSVSAISYKEMALCNIAFCYARIGDREASRGYYEKALSEFPESILAKSALDIFKTL